MILIFPRQPQSTAPPLPPPSRSVHRHSSHVNSVRVSSRLDRHHCHHNQYHNCFHSHWHNFPKFSGLDHCHHISSSLAFTLLSSSHVITITIVINIIVIADTGKLRIFQTASHHREQLGEDNYDNPMVMAITLMVVLMTLMMMEMFLMLTFHISADGKYQQRSSNC